MGQHSGFRSVQKSLDQQGSGIHIKKSRKGLLHKKLGIPQGQPIPESRLKSAKKSKSPALRKEATFAENAKHFRH